MTLSINNNLMALTAFNNLNRSYNALTKSVDQLSSGLRINSSADDAAGLAVRELMRSDIAVLNQGIRNANDAISMLQTMDGSAQVIDEKLIRMKELAEQAATATYSDTQRAMMDDEFQAMAAEVERIAQATDFNGIKMLNGAGSTAATFQVIGVAEEANDFAATASFITAFVNFSTGEDVVLSGTDHNGMAVSSTFTVTADTTINSITAFINDAFDEDGSGVSVSWTDHEGLSIADDISGVSQLGLSFLGGAQYAFVDDSSLGGTVGEDAGDGQVKIHFGTGNESSEDYYYVNNQDMTRAGLGIDGLDIGSQDNAQVALGIIDTAIIEKDTARAHFGSMMNRLQNTVSNLTIQTENIQAAESQISDVDVAFEMTQFINTQIKAQAAVAMLAQANTMPQMALQLLS